MQCSLSRRKDLSGLRRTEISTQLKNAEYLLIRLGQVQIRFLYEGKKMPSAPAPLAVKLMKSAHHVRVRVNLRLTVSQSVLVSSPIWGS
jgi:hypothetical protein